MFRRSFLTSLIGGVTAISLRTPAASRDTPIDVIDAMPTFWKFWDSNVDQPSDVRVRAFFDTVVGSYPDLFHHGLIASGSLTDLRDAPEAQNRVAEYLQDLPPFIPTMRRITTDIHENFSRYVKEFSYTFRDYAPTTPVCFTVSLFGFSGGMNFSGDATGLYFGIDELARTLESIKFLKFVIEHELFHQYHYQIAPEISADNAAWAYMWEEGLATYVCRKMNPRCTVDDALVIPSRLSELARPHLRELAQRFVDNPDSTDPTILAELFSADKAPQGWPVRSGYYLGYRTAEMLGANRSVTQLAHLRGDELKHAVLSTVTQLRNEA
jgi:hypothetical protein